MTSKSTFCINTSSRIFILHFLVLSFKVLVIFFAYLTGSKRNNLIYLICYTGNALESSDGRTYYFSTEKKTWQLAEIDCSLRGGHLPSVMSNAFDMNDLDERLRARLVQLFSKR